MKWWGWLVAGAAATLIFSGLSAMLNGLGVLKLSGSRFEDVHLGGLLIIWSICIAAPLILKAIEGTKESRDSADHNHGDTLDR